MNDRREPCQRVHRYRAPATFCFYFLPLILWMGVIFYFSSQPFSRQDLKPWLSEKIPDRSVERLFGDVRVQYGKSEISVKRLGEIQFVQFWIRKAAHVFEYFILGLLAVRLWRRLNHHISGLGILLVFLFCALYAVTDEIHQYFTGNRTPMVQDVILDSMAALAAILLYRIVVRRRLHHV